MCDTIFPGKCILEISVRRRKEGYWVLIGVPERWLGKICIRLSFFQAKQVWKKACPCAQVLGSGQLICSVLGKCGFLSCKTSLSNESSWLHFSNDLSLHWRQVLLNCPNKHREIRWHQFSGSVECCDSGYRQTVLVVPKPASKWTDVLTGKEDAYDKISEIIKDCPQEKVSKPS